MEDDDDISWVASASWDTVGRRATATQNPPSAVEHQNGDSSSSSDDEMGNYEVWLPTFSLPKSQKLSIPSFS